MMHYLIVNKKYLRLDKKPSPRRKGKNLSCHPHSYPLPKAVLVQPKVPCLRQLGQLITLHSNLLFLHPPIQITSAILAISRCMILKKSSYFAYLQFLHFQDRNDNSVSIHGPFTEERQCHWVHLIAQEQSETISLVEFDAILYNRETIISSR